MTFGPLFNQLANNPAFQNQTLSDGQLSCRYAELPALLTQIDEFFKTQDFPLDTCFALNFDNHLPAALVLLYLLAHERSVFLAPKPQKLDPLSLTPNFCHYILSLNTDKKLDTLDSLAGSLQFQAHPHYQDKRQRPIVGGRLYLKTSGSMGVSKIVEHEFSALASNVQNCVARFRLSPADRVLIPVPIFHMYGLGAGLLPALLAGAHIELLDKTNILKYIQVEKRFNPSAAFLTPTLCTMLLQGKRSDRAYRLVVSAGDKLKPEVFKDFAKRFGGLVNLYGSTELGALMTSDLDDEIDTRAAYAGKPMPGVKLKLDSVDQNLGNAEGVGELNLQYAHSFSQYVDATGATLVTRHPTDWFATGDLARQHDSGYVELLGRSGLSVNRRGYLVMFSDVEQRVESLEAVEKAVLSSSQEDTQQGQRLILFCLVPNANLSAEDIRQTCFEKLPNYAVPDEVRVFTEFPLLPSGKVDRRTLSEQV